MASLQRPTRRRLPYGATPMQTVALLATLSLLLVSLSAVAKARRPSQGEERGPAPAWQPHGYRDQLHRLGSAPDLRAAVDRLIRLSALEAFGVAAQESHEEFRELLPGGDLNGDGLGDALDVSETSVTALKGIDGTELWTRPFQGEGYPVLGGTLDQSAGDDLVVIELESEEAPEGELITTRFVGLSGTSGSVLWTRSYQAVWAEVSTPGGGYGYQGVGAASPENLPGVFAGANFVFPVGSGDLTGDGTPDLLLGRYDVVDGPVGIAAGAVFHVVSGRDGALGAAFTAAPGLGFPDAVVVPDLTGDGAADVLTLSGTPTAGGAETRVVAFSGKGGPPTWQSSVPSEYAYAEGVRLNADARTDVLLSIDDETTELRALDGSNGAPMWTRALTDWGYALPSGDAVGDGGADLLVITGGSFFGFSGSSEQRSASQGGLGIPTLPGHTGAEDPCYGCGPCGPQGCQPPHALLVAGGSGAILWDKTAADDEYVSSTGDATGDGIGDVLLVRDPGGSINVAARLLSGKTGAQAWTRNSTFDSLDAIHGDLNKDGAKDLLLVDYASQDRTQAVNGKTGANLWTSARNVGGYLMSLYPSALGTNGDDLLETVWVSSATRRAGRNGNDGAELWRRT